MEESLFIQFIVSWLLGGLVWLERELPTKRFWKNTAWDPFGWLRSYALISILWTISAWLDLNFKSWFFTISTLFIVSSFIFLSYSYWVFKKKDLSVTTEYAWIITFFIGVLVVFWWIKIAVIFAIIIAFLLSWKDYIEKIKSNISKQELIHTLKFWVIAFVVLPLLPDKKYSFATLLNDFWASWALDIKNTIWQMQFLNPYSIWFFVVAISSIWYIWYILSRFFSKNSSIMLSWMVWWLVSSTAVTATMSEQSKNDPKNFHMYVVWTLLANTIMLARVVIIVLIFNISLLWTVFIPASLIFLVLFIATYYYYNKSREMILNTKLDIESSLESPFSIMPALKFWLFVLAIKFIASIGLLYKDIWWEWLFYYVLWIISWFADVDAITQTMTIQSREFLVSSNIAVSTILLAVMSNNLVKWTIALKFWDKLYWKIIMTTFLISIALWIFWIIIINTITI